MKITKELTGVHVLKILKWKIYQKKKTDLNIQRILMEDFYKQTDRVTSFKMYQNKREKNMSTEYNY